MNSQNDIPILNVIRKRLVAAIAEHPSRRQLNMAPALTVLTAVAIVIVIAVFVATRSGANGRQLRVRDSVARPTATSSTISKGGAATADATTTVTASTPSPVTRTTIPKPPTSTTPTRGSTATTLPAPTTITLTFADRYRTAPVLVNKGTTIDVQLTGDSTAVWPSGPSSTDGAVVLYVSGSSSATSSQAQFVAIRSGTAQLTAIGGLPCMVPTTGSGALEGCPAVGILWTVTVQVR
jgi:hypothetical protein